MASADQILSGINGLRAAVSKVTRAWEPADLPRVEASRITLQNSIPNLRRSLVNIPSDVRLQKAAEALRDEISNLEFLVDAAAAFVRSAVSAEGQNYTLAGEIRPEAAPASTAAYTG
jgi:hypothetical protein